jgi:transcription initiation factor TFIIE subunit alpha
MPQKSLTDLATVQDFLETIGGQEIVDLVKICERKRKAFTDEDISKKMNIKVTEVRALLNKLHFRGIACYQKSRNQKTGWYNYTWEIKKNRIASLIVIKQQEVLEKLSEKKSLESDYNFFDCKNCNERLPFELATEYNFMCPACGGVMDSANNPKRQKEILKKIDQIEAEITVLSQITD